MRQERIDKFNSKYLTYKADKIYLGHLIMFSSPVLPPDHRPLLAATLVPASALFSLILRGITAAPAERRHRKNVWRM